MAGAALAFLPRLIQWEPVLMGFPYQPSNSIHSAAVCGGDWRDSNDALRPSWDKGNHLWDRIPFDTDHRPSIGMYQTYFRFLETADECFEYDSDPLDTASQVITRPDVHSVLR